jgi:plastocyanin
MRNHKLVGVVAALSILSVFTFLISGNLGILPGPVQAAPALQQATQQVDIALKEWELIPPQLSINAGDSVTFNISNTGRFGHALEVSGNGIHENSAIIGGGATTTLSFSFEFSGTYRILCPVAGHEGLGMFGEITVEGSNPAPASGCIRGRAADASQPSERDSGDRHQSRCEPDSARFHT